ncbi:MAG: hypothetical protein E6K58_05225, partial [Nitrospirae bacterium]
MHERALGGDRDGLAGGPGHGGLLEGDRKIPGRLGLKHQRGQHPAAGGRGGLGAQGQRHLAGARDSTGGQRGGGGGGPAKLQGLRVKGDGHEGL